ncbi:type II secretion system protein M [Oxalobacteraceae bacterium OM1]|nr:type II secretion system protein M [Oxalobacteraceae bacterium OM1]
MQNVRKQADDLRQRAATFWGARNKRERNLLTIAAVVIIAGLFYVLLIDPALSGRAQLEKQLPALRRQAAEVQSLAREATNLKSSAVTSPPATKESVESSLNSRGLKPQNVIINGELVRVQLNGASFASLLDWLTEMQRTARLAVLDANIDGQPQPDTVNANLTLRQQRGEPTQ